MDLINESILRDLGGTLYYRSNISNLTATSSGQIDFYGTFQQNVTAYTNSVFVNSALATNPFGTAVYFTVRVIASLVPHGNISQCLVSVWCALVLMAQQQV
jgi:hypothetical protein